MVDVGSMSLTDTQYLTGRHKPSCKYVSACYSKLKGTTGFCPCILSVVYLWLHCLLSGTWLFWPRPKLHLTLDKTLLKYNHNGWVRFLNFYLLLCKYNKVVQEWLIPLVINESHIKLSRHHCSHISSLTLLYIKCHPYYSFMFMLCPWAMNAMILKTSGIKKPCCFPEWTFIIITLYLIQIAIKSS